MSARFCTVWLHRHLNTLRLQLRRVKPSLPTIPFDIVAYAYTLLWDNLFQNSCMRYYKMGLMRNELKLIFYKLNNAFRASEVSVG